MLRSRFSPSAVRRKGQTLLEFALTFPLLLVMFLGILEIGWMAFNQTANLNAARAAARAGSLGQNNASVTLIAKANSYGLPISTVEIAVTTEAGVTVTDTENRTTGNIVFVTTKMPYTAIGPLFNFLPRARVSTLACTVGDRID